MTIGEKLLNLSIEYQESLSNREQADTYAGVPDGREPQTIAADYEAALKQLLQP